MDLCIRICKIAICWCSSNFWSQGQCWKILQFSKRSIKSIFFWRPYLEFSLYTETGVQLNNTIVNSAM